jgi:hypothetical protein
MGNLVYIQCTNPDCCAIGCRSKKIHVTDGSYCLLCKSKTVEITWDVYERKLHYAKTLHEEGLLPNR